MHDTLQGKLQYILGVNGYCFIKSTESPASADLRKQMAFIRNAVLALE